MTIGHFYKFCARCGGVGARGVSFRISFLRRGSPDLERIDQKVRKGAAGRKPVTAPILGVA